MQQNQSGRSASRSLSSTLRAALAGLALVSWVESSQESLLGKVNRPTPLTWSPCAESTNLDCGTLLLPADHDTRHPAADFNIDRAIERYPIDRWLPPAAASCPAQPVSLGTADGERSSASDAQPVETGTVVGRAGASPGDAAALKPDPRSDR